MKKASFPVLPLILGLVFIVIIILAFGPWRAKLADYYKEGGLLGAKKPIDEESPVVKGAVKKQVGLITIPLTEDHDKALKELTFQILSCWQNVGKPNDLENYKHAYIKIPYLKQQITKNELAEEIKKTDSTAANEMLYWWNDPTEKSDGLTLGTYLLCCDYDATTANDIYLTTDTGFDCE
jgi:hypothetical protein